MRHCSLRLDANQTPETTTKEEGHVGLWDLNKIQGFNFVNWVKNSFTKKSFYGDEDGYRRNKV